LEKILLFQTEDDKAPFGKEIPGGKVESGETVIIKP
jgi:hypothetical protein